VWGLEHGLYNLWFGDLTDMGIPAPLGVGFGKLPSAGLLMLLPVGSVCSPNGVGEFSGANGRSVRIPCH